MAAIVGFITVPTLHLVDDSMTFSLRRASKAVAVVAIASVVCDRTEYREV